MRALLLLVALVILAAIVLVYTGVVSLGQTQPAKFDLKVNKVEVGTTTANVQVPTVGTKTKQVDVPVVRVQDSNAAAH